jgi:transposase
MATHHPNRALPVHELEERRMQAGRYFNNGKTAYFIEKHFGVSSTTAREWRSRWKNGALKAGHQGNASKLTEAQKKDLAKHIVRGPRAAGYETELWTLSRITALIMKKEKVRYAPRSVWHLLHAIGFSCQKPTRRAKERDEQAIQAWVQREWPKLQKRGLA